MRDNGGGFVVRVRSGFIISNFSPSFELEDEMR